MLSTSNSHFTNFPLHVNTIIVLLRHILYEGKSISKLQSVIEKKRMVIMTYKQHLFFNVISKQM